MKEYRIAYLMSDLPRIGPCAQTLNILCYSGLKERCIVITLYDEKNSQNSMLSEYTDAGVQVVCLHLRNRSFALPGKKAFLRALRDYNIDIVQSFGGKTDFFAHYALKNTAIKHIIALRALPYEEIPTRRQRLQGLALAKLYIGMLKKSHYIIACSEHIEQQMKNCYQIKNIVAIKNGVDITKYNCEKKSEKDIRSTLGIADGHIVFIWTGRICLRKRTDELIKAFLAAERGDIELIVLGGGPQEEDSRALAAQNRRIHFPGKTSSVQDFLWVSDVFVSSSESEGLPNSVIEALACGLPTILSDIPQHKETLKELPNAGILYPLGDVASLAKIFATISKSDIEAMKKYTAGIFDSSMTMTKMAAGYRRYYDDIMK